MGSCPGRLRGITEAEVIAAARSAPPAEAGDYPIRPPIKEVTLGEQSGLALLDDDASASRADA
jgi:hypothetical protein